MPVFYVCVGRLSVQAVLYIRGLEFPRGPRVNRWDEKNGDTNLRLGRLFPPPLPVKKCGLKRAINHQ